MQKKYNNDIVRMEKKATNKFGLFLLFIIVLGAGGYGTYYLYKNRNNLEWDLSIPWKDKDKTSNKVNNKNDNDKTSTSNQTDLTIPRLDEEEFSIEGDIIKITKVTADDKGYNLEVEAIAKKSNEVKFICEKVLIDGFDTTAKFEVTDYNEGNSTPTVATFRINKTELDALNIKSFKKLEFYLKKKNSSEETNISRYELIAFNTIDVDNSIKGLVKIDEKNATIINYYQTIEDKDYTYIYFDIKNQDRTVSANISVKRLLINDKVYEYTDLNEVIYRGTEKVIYLKIPKKDIREVNKFTISFFLIEENVKKENRKVYISNEFTKEF